jgi:hypothetical protein
MCFDEMTPNPYQARDVNRQKGSARKRSNCAPAPARRMTWFACRTGTSLAIRIART